MLSIKSSGFFNASVIKECPEKCKMLVGISCPVLKKLFKYLCSDVKGSGTRTPRATMEDQITITLLKLKQNVGFDMLGYVNNIGQSTAADYLWKWIDIMYLKLKFLIRMQDRDYVYDNIPNVFKLEFPGLTSIIDYFEIFVESPSSLMARAQFYSQYKRHCTIKVLISCTPLGAINYISKCYGGRASDIQITRESGFTTSKYHMPGDQILADRGFTLKYDFAAGASTELLIPAFTRGKSQLSAKEVEVSRKVASVRIHIERVIGLLKNR